MAKSASKTEKLRNIGIIAHIDAGKTTLSERILYYARKIHRMGEVHDGTATMDYLPEEQERGITISAATTSCQWQDYIFNLIDTPGHVDFTMEVERSLRVLDGAVGVFCAVGGVEPQSETVWRQSEQFQVPKLAFVNKMDRLGANFQATLESLKIRLNINPLAITLPLGEGETFEGIVDLVKMQRLDFDPQDQGTTVHAGALSDFELKLAAPWREKLLEGLAEADDAFLEQYFGEGFEQADIEAALRRAALARTAVPVLCGSALRNIGIQPLMDAVGLYLPSPLDNAGIPVHDPENGQTSLILLTSDAPLLALAFKVLLDGGRKMAMLRIYSGSLKEGDQVRNVGRQTNERISRLYRLHADRREQLAEAEAGDIVAVLGLRSALTGDTIAQPDQKMLLESVAAYQPVISMALEPRNADEGKSLDEALERYSLEDPTLTVKLDEGSGHRLVSGMGELHLDVLLERLRREYLVQPRAGQPQVVQRETIAHAAEAEGLFDKELGNVRHHGEVVLAVSPLERGLGNKLILDQTLTGGKDGRNSAGVPKALVEDTLQGISDILLSGPLTGYPLQDIEVRLLEIRRKEGLTTGPGCHMAAGIAMRQALQAAKPLALEPIMFVEIGVPEEYLGSAINLLNITNGRVVELFDRAGLKIIQGLAPMRKLFGFSTSLRSATQGRAGLTMRFETFDVA